MVKRITDTNEQCRPINLNLPESYRPLFAAINSKSSSTACRQLIAYALEHGALAALTGQPPAQVVVPPVIDVDDLPDSALTPDQLAERYAE